MIGHTWKPGRFKAWVLKTGLKEMRIRNKIWMVGGVEGDSEDWFKKKKKSEIFPSAKSATLEWTRS